jgi:hypothetical protein
MRQQEAVCWPGRHSSPDQTTAWDRFLWQAQSLRRGIIEPSKTGPRTGFQQSVKLRTCNGGNTDANTHSYVYSGAYCDVHSYAKGIADTNCNCYSHTHSNSAASVANTDGDARAKPNPDANSFAFAKSDTYRHGCSHGNGDPRAKPNAESDTYRDSDNNVNPGLSIYDLDHVQLQRYTHP